MTRFDRVKEILDAAVAGESVHAHGPFWRGLTRDQFVQKAVFNVPLISVGDGSNSNLIHALRGELPFGSDTGNPDAHFRRMPAGRAPVSAPDIAFIKQWIDEGCPEDVFDLSALPSSDPSVHRTSNPTTS
jgi:hypothetical protein